MTRAASLARAPHNRVCARECNWFRAALCTRAAVTATHPLLQRRNNHVPEERHGRVFRSLMPCEASSSFIATGRAHREREVLNGTTSTLPSPQRGFHVL